MRRPVGGGGGGGAPGSGEKAAFGSGHAHKRVDSAFSKFFGWRI